MRKKVFVLVSDGVSIRNFAFTSFNRLAKERDLELVFWNTTTFNLKELNLNEIKFDKPRVRTITDLLKTALIRIELNQFTKRDKDHVYHQYKFPLSQKTWKLKIRSLLVKGIISLFNSEKGIHFLRSKLRSLERQTDYYKSSKALLEKHKPDFILSASQRDLISLAPLEAASSLGIPTGTFIYSWDNIPKATTMIDADYYFVWSDLMKNELLHFYPSTVSNNINVVGTPQFEPYVLKRYNSDKASFIEKFKLNPNKRIIYIPQSYLNRVVDHEKKNTDIDDIIKEVLLQDEDFSDWYSLLSLKEKEINDNIEDGIKSLYEKIKTHNENNSDLKKIGDEKGVNEQIKKINQEIKTIQGKLKLEKEDIDKFNLQIEKIKKQKLEIEFLQEDIKNLNQLKEVKASIYSPFEFSFKSESISNEVEKITNSKIKFYSDDWKNEITKLIDSQKKKRDGLIAVNTKNVTDLKPLQDEVDGQKSLTKKYKELEEEQKKQQIILNLKKKKNNARLSIDEISLQLSEFASKFYSIYLEAKDKINLENLDDELVFDIKTEFKDTDFSELFIRTFFDGRSIIKSEYDHLTKYRFSSKESFKEFIHKIIWNILKKELPLRHEGNSREVITGLLKNWFIHNYKVEYQGDLINDMSPGKKSFVLLRLLVDLDNSKCPILIDQPEDDLDNQTIYDDVIKLIRELKPATQFILATHNANIPVLGDAEQVIACEYHDNQIVLVTGSIDCADVQQRIVSIMEGGAEAFEKRKQVYEAWKPKNS